MSPVPDRPGRESGPSYAFLLLTAAVGGAAVLTLEVMGSRVIGPFFGVSLFVWTSLIAVTLMALAVGYAVGGWLADRHASAGALYTLIAVAGLLTLAIPLLRSPVLEASVGLGLRAGSLVASLVLFGPVLAVLGAVTPFLVRLAVRQLDAVGRTVGVLYAVSTLGSVVGAVLTGYVLITWIGVNGIFSLVAGALLVLSVAYFAVLRGRFAALALLAALAVRPGAPPLQMSMPDGTRVTQVASAQSLYGQVKVVDYRFGALATRELVIDGLVQGGIDRASGQSVYEYLYFMQHIPRALAPRGRRCLMVGLGAGIIARWFEAQGVRTDVVEIDPVVVRMAREHFGMQVSGQVVIADARHFMLTSQERYDYVLLDVFNGDTTPGYLLSVEAVTLAQRRLAPGGVLAVNLVGSLRERSFVTASVVKTLESRFDQVEVYPAFDPGRTGAGNMVLVAYDGPERALDPHALARVPVHRLVAPVVRARLGRRFRFPQGTPAVILSDDFNPADVRDAWLREQVREEILESTHRDLLMGSAPGRAGLSG
jgi:spermidine synthase